MPSRKSSENTWSPVVIRRYPPIEGRHRTPAAPRYAVPDAWHPRRLSRHAIKCGSALPMWGFLMPGILFVAIC